ncbi:MAG: J domain-containing protein [Candidatus Obscuribacterales bacterium]|nr:J domain-containing protein [Candidatus Obscuribacterales bacterium]
MSVKYKDYYQTLGVSRQATDKEIKAAYRKLAREHHPDVNIGNKNAEEKFKELTEAYEVLKDPEKRRRYDMLGANWKAGADFNPPPGFGGFNFDFGNLGGFGKATASSPFSDFFDMLFGQTFGPGAQAGGAAGADGGPRRTARSIDQEAEIELSIEEIARGTSRNVQISRPGQATRALQVKIPAGVRPGSKVRVKGEAASAAGAPAGDLFLKVRVKPHPFLTIEGDNLISELQVSAPLAILGGEASVNTLDGAVHINIPPFSQNSRMLRLRERGLPKLKQTVRGDHLVRLKIQLPTSLSPEEKALYEELLKIEKSKKSSN